MFLSLKAWDRLAEYAVVNGGTDAPTAVHVPSGVFLHSRFDPCREAAELTVEYGNTGSQETVLLGGGLGYLAEAILRNEGKDHRVTVLEPEPALLQLAKSCRSGSEYVTSPNIRILPAATVSAMQKVVGSLSGDANLIIAPYYKSLSRLKDLPLAGFVQSLASQYAARSIYSLRLEQHRTKNQQKLAELPSALNVRLPKHKVPVVVGAGPSLDLCIEHLQSCRYLCLLIAASGAAPSLVSANLDPDWIIALEALDAVVEDMPALRKPTNLIVFSSTHPDVLKTENHTLYSGAGNPEGELFASAGTSVAPALDFALRCSNLPVFLVGVDLTYRHGAYAHGAQRKESQSRTSDRTPPKFLAMRTGLERLLDVRSLSGKKRTVYQILQDGTPLTGAVPLNPEELPDKLMSITDSVNHHG